MPGRNIAKSDAAWIRYAKRKGEVRLSIDHTLRDRRKRARRAFLTRVAVLLIMIVAVAYGAWFAPWARPVRHISVKVNP